MPKKTGNFDDLTIDIQVTKVRAVWESAEYKNRAAYKIDLAK